MIFPAAGSALMDLLFGFARWANKALMLVAGCFLVAMIVLACANIFLRMVWLPISGTFELMGYFGAVVTAFALGYTQMSKGHIAVDIVLKAIPQKGQRYIQITNHIICMGFFGIVSWRIAGYAGTLWTTGEVTETLGIVYYPFVYCVALGCAVLALVFLADLVRLFQPAREGKK